MTETTYREALRDAIREALAADDRVFVMGEDVADYGGTYAVTRDLHEEFGRDRVRNTPLAESGFVGAGIGAAYHQLDDIYFTGNPNLTNHIHGNNDIAFAWSLMAGVGVQLTDRAVLDVGYRYIDTGSITSQRSDTGFNVNPAVKFDDLTAHELKVGLRYHFGEANCCAETSFK